MSQKGFTLVAAMVSVAVAGIAMLASLAIIKSITATLNLSQANNEVINQIYELKVALTDPVTCRENFSSVNISTGTVALTQPLRPLQLGGAGLSTSARLLPDRAEQPGLRVYADNLRLIRNPAVATLANLSIEFASPSFPTEIVRREFPMYVVVDPGGNITSCTAGSPGVIGPPPPPPSAGRTCDGANVPPTSNFPTQEAREAVRTQICDQMRFPTAAAGGELNCAIANQIFQQAGLNYPRVDHTAGLTFNAEINRQANGNIRACIGLAASEPVFIAEFGGLQSREDCMANPYYHEGSHHTSTNGVNYICVNGRWAPGSVPTPTPDPGGS